MSMAMGAPPAALRREPSSVARIATAARTQAQTQARTAGRGMTTRIGTVQVVVRTEAPEQRAVRTAAPALRESKQPAQPPAVRPFRNPWMSSKWRGD